MSVPSVLGVLESELGASLPQDYAQFLVAGLRGPEGKYVTCDVDEECADVSWSLRHLFTLDDLCEGVPYVLWLRRVVATRNLGEGVIPEGSLVIGGVDPREDLLLFVSGRRRGQVWLIDICADIDVIGQRWSPA